MTKRIFITLSFLFISTNSFAFWMWTPETNKWVNPKFAVKETPAEQLHYALEFYEAKEYAEARAELKKLLKHYPKAREAPEAQYYLARIFEDQDNLYEAFKEYQMVIDKYPFSDRSAEVVQKQYDIGVQLTEGKGQRKGIMATLAISEYDVVEVFESVIKNAPYGKLASPAQYKIGLYLMEKGLYQEARDAFEKVINNYPDSEWAKAAKYQIAMSDAKRSTAAAYDQKITEVAVKEFKDFVEVYPDAELSKDAKAQITKLRDKEAENNFLIAEFYEKHKNYKAAKIYYQSIINDYKNSSWSAKALARIQALGGKQ